MLRSRIVGVGSALPEVVVGNDAVERQLGVESGWIEGRTGVVERRILGDADALVDLAEAAARSALTRAQIAPKDLDAIVVATTSGPYMFPSLGCLLHDRLGVGISPAFDVAAACAGFPYALTVADQGIRAGDQQKVLVVGADRLSALCEPTDRVTTPLFGDGAGAVVLQAEQQPDDAPNGILVCRLRALGELWPILYVRAGARDPAALPPDGPDPWMRMKGQDVFRAAVEHLVALTREVLDVAGIAADDVKLLVPHQANVRIIRMMTSQLKIPEERVGINLDRCGNTSAASIPIALDEATQAGRLETGDVLVVNAVGGGMTAGAIVARW